MVTVQTQGWQVSTAAYTVRHWHSGETGRDKPGVRSGRGAWLPLGMDVVVSTLRAVCTVACNIRAYGHMRLLLHDTYAVVYALQPYPGTQKTHLPCR